MSNKETAKNIRRDIRAAIKSGDLPNIKVSVTSGTWRFNVVIKSWSDCVMYTENYCQDQSDHWNRQKRYTEEAWTIISKLNAICNEYHESWGDINYDTYDCNFVPNPVELDYSLADEQLKRSQEFYANEPDDIKAARHQAEWDKEEAKRKEEQRIYEENQKQREKEIAEHIAKAEAKTKRQRGMLGINKIRPIENDDLPSKLSHVVIEWSENRLADSFKDIPISVKDMDRVIYFIVAGQKPGHGYDKTKLTVFWQNGDSYQFRCDISPSESETIEQRIEDMASFMTLKETPGHMTREAHENYVNNVCGGIPEFYTRIGTELLLN